VFRTIAGAVALVAAVAQFARAAEPFVLEKTIPLEGVEGRIDHMSADVRGNRLFVSALVNKTLEVIDWSSGTRVRSVPDLNEPQGVVYVPANNRIYIATRGDGRLTILDGATFQVIKIVELGENADNVRFDAVRSLVWVGYGSGSLAALDLDGKRVADIAVGHHPESFQLARTDARIFVNLPNGKDVAVLDRNSKSVVTRWGTGLDFSNFPMTLDEPSKRLFVITRTPARALVYDTNSGKTVAKFETVGDSDDAFYDAARRRLYVVGGEGFIDTYSQDTPDHYTRIVRLSTAAGARTALFVPEAGRLFLAVPHRDQQRTEIRVFKASEVGK
jgi:DNA-binding beta-propeller fold protein YncE